MLLLQQHNGRVSVTRLQLRLRTIRPGDASWCECCLKQSSCCPVRSARLFTLSICFLLLLKNPPVWFLPLKCNSFNLLNLFMMKTNRSSDRNTQGHVLSQSFFGESYISPQLPEHFSSDTAASSLCCVLSTVLFCLKHALRSSCGKLKFRAHCSVFMRLCIYPRILLWKFSHSRLAGAGADCLILSHRWRLRWVFHADRVKLRHLGLVKVTPVFYPRAVQLPELWESCFQCLLAVFKSSK